MLKKVASTMYPTTDKARAMAFYENTLGLAPGAVGGHGDTYWIEYDLPGGGCLAISNAGPTKPSGTAGGPNCRMIVCLDPDGNSLLLHKVGS